MGRRIDDAHGAADFRGDPQRLAVRGKLGDARPRVDKDIVRHLEGRGVDEMRHVGGFGGVDEHLAVGADAHAFRLDAYGHLGQNRVLLHVEHRDHVVVLVGDIERIAHRVEDEELRIGSAAQAAKHLARRRVDDLDGVVVAGAEIEKLAVLRDRDAAWPAADLPGRDDFELFGIDHRYGVVLLVRDVDLVGVGRQRCADQESGSTRERQQVSCGELAHGDPPNSRRCHSLHSVSGKSLPSVSSGVRSCRKPRSGATETSDLGCATSTGWRNC